MLIKPKEVVQQEYNVEHNDEMCVAARELLSSQLKWKLQSYFEDRDGWKILTYRIKESYRHDKASLKEAKKEMSEDTYALASFVCWVFYGIKVIVYILAWLSNPLNMFNSHGIEKSQNYSKLISMYNPVPPITEPSKCNIKKHNHHGEYKRSTYLHTGDACAGERDKIRVASLILRRAIHSNKGVINCVILKTKYRKVEGYELLEAQSLGEFSKPFMEQEITFGDQINKAIKVMLGDRIEMKKKKDEVYLLIHNGNIPTLAEELGKLFNEEVRIKVTSND